MSQNTLQNRRLSEIMKLEKGKPPLQQPYYGPDAERYLTPDYLRGGSTTEPVMASTNAVRIEDGDVIILWDGSNAGEVFYGRNGILASTMSRVSHSGEIDQRYYYYAIKGWETYLKGQTSGSGIPHVDKEILGHLSIIEFDKPEQSAIAEVLSTVDRAIEQTETLIAKQQRIKTGLMQDLLTRGIDENGNLRSEDTHEFKDSPLGRIPVDWSIEKLSTYTEFVTSGARGWAQYYRDDGAIFLRIGNLTRKHLNLRLDDLVFVKPPVSAEGRRTSVLEGDLLISVTADLGIIGVIPSGFGEGYVNQHIALARPDHKAICSRFVGWFFASRHGKNQFDRLNESGAKAGLNLPTVRALLFPKPDCIEQKKISAIIDASVMLLDKHIENRRKLVAIKTGLMQDLLKGKVRVTPLLERQEAMPI